MFMGRVSRDPRVRHYSNDDGSESTYLDVRLTSKYVDGSGQSKENWVWATASRVMALRMIDREIACKDLLFVRGRLRSRSTKGKAGVHTFIDIDQFIPLHPPPHLFTRGFTRIGTDELNRLRKLVSGCSEWEIPRSSLQELGILVDEDENPKD